MSPLTQDEERALVAQAAAGQRESFANLVRAYHVQLRSQVALTVPSTDDVLDIVQDAFIDAFEHLRDFDQARDFGPWLRAICRNRTTSHHRRRSTVRRHTIRLVDEALAEHVEQSGDLAADGDDRLGALRCCLENLTLEHRQVLERRFRDDVPVKDIASALGRSANAVSMILLRLKSALMECVDRRLKRSP